MKPTTRQRIFWTLLSLLLIAGISFGGWKLYRAKFWASSFRKAMTYADKRRGLRTDYSLFIDYSVPSGTPRLYVWSFERGKS